MTEFTSPSAPTAKHQRLPAVRLYVEGEALCDAHAVAEGMSRMREALALAWELDLPEWPGWAEALYHQLTNGLLPVGAPPPPLLAADTSSAQPDVAAHVRNGQRWWAGDAALSAIAGALRTRNHVVVDGFLGRAGGRALRTALERAWDDGVLQPAKVALPGSGLNGQRSDRTRSDHIAWIDCAADARWAPLAELVAAADALAIALRRAAPELAGEGSAISRMRPMASRYGVGAAFARHTDNHCRSGRGPHCNGRWLTAVYYCNEAWSEADGGCLRLYRPQDDGGGDDQTGEAAAEAAAAGDALLDVAPVGDRLLVFFSDFRSPHEVLPAAAPRFATTLWYMERDAGSVRLEQPCERASCVAVGPVL